jgi:hypothetical protein
MSALAAKRDDGDAGSKPTEVSLAADPAAQWDSASLLW